ncbi:MAG: hypothetical protein Q9217_000174 [Psora testacea]
MENISPDDLQILQEKSRTFCGSFKIPLSKLKFEDIPDKPRQLDWKNVANLVRKFGLEDCKRLEPEHYVSALVSRADLPQGLRADDKLFQEPQHFDPQQPLICIDGEHRLEAADQFLAGEERWWVANLYSDDINVHTKNVLREQDSGSAKYFDGDIYRQIRIAALDKKTTTTARKNKWLARLSPEKRRNVLRMEMARYLSRVKHTWSCIIGEREDYQNKLDANTVHILQGRCPFRSLDDRAYVEAELLKGNILPAVKSPDLQKKLLQRILAVEHTIPSIYTFLEDTKCLEPGARILKGVLPTKCKGSLAQAFRALHNGQTRFKEQTSAFSYRHRDLPTGSEVEWLSYRQLWLLPIRHFPTPKKDSAKWKKVGNGTARGKRKRDDNRHDVDSLKAAGPVFRRQWLRQLALLASANGYRQIRQADHELESADADMARDFLLNVRPPTYYQLEGDRLRQKMQLICQVLEDIEEGKAQTRQPEVTSDHDDCGSDIEDRCGRPQEHSVKKDEENLFLNHIYPVSLATVPKKYMTSFGWKRDMFHFFFGIPENKINAQERSEEDPSSDIDGNVGEVGDASGPANLPATDSGGCDKTLAANDSVGSDEIQPTPSTLTPSLADAHSVSPAHMPMQTDEDHGPVAVQSERDIVISLAEASRSIFNGQADTDNQKFTVLSPTKNNSFRSRCADPHDKADVVAALRLPSNAHFMTRAGGKRLKLVDPSTVAEEAHSNQLRTVISVPRHGAQDLISLLEGNAKSGKL